MRGCASVGKRINAAANSAARTIARGDASILQAEARRQSRELTWLATPECDAVPVQIVREPAAQLEVALAGRAVAPDGRDLRDSSMAQRRLDRELEPKLEARGALDRSGVEETPAVQLEVVGRVV